MKQNIYGFILNQLESKKPVVLATIYKRSGSSPRGEGAFMAISDDGRVVGTIGGGKLEATIQENLITYITKSMSTFVQFHLSEADAADLDMICGGNVSVLVESVFPDQKALVEMFRGMEKVIQKQTCGWLVSKLPSKIQDEKNRVMKAFIEPDGKITGNWSIQADIVDQQLVSLDLPEGEHIDTQSLNINRQAQLLTTEAAGCFLEPVGQFSKVYLIGAGHIAQRLAMLTPGVGFKTIVLDDRAEYLSEERFPLADQKIVLKDFSQVFSELTIDGDCSLVIVTRGHSSDKDVLKQALATEAGYIGMIGSSRKIRATFNQLQQEGISEVELKQVHTPIGLSIGAETPEEIAISIVAELIQERAKIKELKNK